MPPEEKIYRWQDEHTRLKKISHILQTCLAKVGKKDKNLIINKL